MTSSNHSVPTTPSSWLGSSWCVATRSSEDRRHELEVPVSWWVGSWPCTSPNLGQELICSRTSGHWQEVGTQVLPVWSGCLPGSWCLSRICWFAATASPWRSTCNGRYGHWTSPGREDGEHSLGEPELRRKPHPTPMPRPLLPYKIPMVFIGQIYNHALSTREFQHR